MHFVSPARWAIRQLSQERYLTPLAMRTALCAVSLLLYFLSAAASYGQQTPPKAGIGVRVATPEEIKQSIEAEDRLIQATQPIEGLPQRLAYYIGKELPLLSVLGRSDATSDNWRNSAENGQPSPFICFGDFDGNGLQDAALILRANDSGSLRLMAFHQIEITVNPGNFTKRGYQVYEISSAGTDSPRGPLGDLAISCNPPGTFQSADGNITLGLKNASILFGYSLYYFDGAYQSLLIGD